MLKACSYLLRRQASFGRRDVAAEDELTGLQVDFLAIEQHVSGLTAGLEAAVFPEVGEPGIREAPPFQGASPGLDIAPLSFAVIEGHGCTQKKSKPPRW